MAVTRIRRTGPIVADEVAFTFEEYKSSRREGHPAGAVLCTTRAEQVRRSRTSRTPTSRSCSPTFAQIYREELAELAALGATLRAARRRGVRAHVRSGAPRPGAGRRRRSRTSWSTATCSSRTTRSPAVPESLTVGMHLCRGNNQGKWLGEGGYEPDRRAGLRRPGDRRLLPRVRQRARRRLRAAAHLFADATAAVLGLVSTKTPSSSATMTCLRRDRGGVEVRAAGAPGGQPAVRLREPPRRQRPELRPAGSEAQAGGADRARRLGRSLGNSAPALVFTGYLPRRSG